MLWVVPFYGFWPHLDRQKGTPDSTGVFLKSDPRVAPRFNVLFKVTCSVTILRAPIFFARLWGWVRHRLTPTMRRAESGTGPGRFPVRDVMMFAKTH